MIAFAAIAGQVAARSESLALGLAGLGGGLCLLALGNRLKVLFLVLWAGLLFGYAFLDKGFAYVGAYPIFVSEIVLFMAVLSLVVSTRHLHLTWLHFVLLAFMLWGLSRTVPYIERDGINALRDGALWGYGLFAFTLSAVITAKHFERITSVFSRAILPFLVWMIVASLVDRLWPGPLPTVLGSDVSILTLKSGDMGVHLAGVGAFVILGLTGGRLSGRVTGVLTWVLWLVGVGLVGANSRGGLLAASMAFTAVLLFLPTKQLITRFVLACVLAAAIAAIAPQINVRADRTLSLDQIATNISSIVFDTGRDELEGTKVWRTIWWNKIIDYTFDGPYFWTGKGFGVNLAIEDGIVAENEGNNRSPHDAHFTILARAGVPGLILWALLQAGFGASLLWAYFQARRRGAVFWSKIDAWLLAYWLAMIVNASFDVYFEGPQGGIWFWSVFGLGLAAMTIQTAEMREAEHTEGDSELDPPRGARSGPPRGVEGLMPPAAAGNG